MEGASTPVSVLMLPDLNDNLFSHERMFTEHLEASNAVISGKVQPALLYTVNSVHCNATSGVRRPYKDSYSDLSEDSLIFPSPDWRWRTCNDGITRMVMLLLPTLRTLHIWRIYRGGAQGVIETPRDDIVLGRGLYFGLYYLHFIYVP